MNIAEIASCVAKTFKNFGIERCCLLAHMAAYPKEESDQDPLEESRCIRFRKTTGQHPNCDKCMEYKQLLRAPQGPEQRTLVLEEYCQHIVLQWCDRGMDANCTELSRTCRRMLDMGAHRIAMARQTSFWRIRADGVDQAKFRVPLLRNKVPCLR